MKRILLILLLSSQISADELSANYVHVSQVISEDISFNQPLYALSYSKLLYGNLGAKITLSNGSQHAKSGIYKNKITSLNLYEVFYRVDGGRFLVDFEVGYVDYRTHWLVNNKEVAWSENTDCDFTYGLTVGYKISDNFKLTLGYDDLYRNQRKEKEKTKSLTLGLVYMF